MTLEKRTKAVLSTFSLLGVVACADNDADAETEEAEDLEVPEWAGESGVDLVILEDQEDACSLLSPEAIEEIIGVGGHEVDPGDTHFILATGMMMRDCRFNNFEAPESALTVGENTHLDPAAMLEDYYGEDQRPVEVEGAEEAAVHDTEGKIAWWRGETFYRVEQQIPTEETRLDDEILIEPAETVIRNEG